MAQINVNIRIDEDVKKEAETLFAELGLNMTTAVNMFIRQSLRHGGIPFDVTVRTQPDDGFYNPANMKRLAQSIEQMQQGKFVVKTMDELERMAGDE